MNKAELEARVVKLERSLARARAQTVELKKALKEAQQAAETTKAPPAKAPKTPRKTGGEPVKRGRRSKDEIAAAEEMPETEATQSDE